MCLVDLTDAKDSVDRTLLWTVLAPFGVPPRMPSLPTNFTTACVSAFGLMMASAQIDFVRRRAGSSGRVCARAIAVQRGYRSDAACGVTMLRFC